MKWPTIKNLNLLKTVQMLLILWSDTNKQTGRKRRSLLHHHNTAASVRSHLLLTVIDLMYLFMQL